MASPGRKPLPTNIIRLKGTSQAKLRERNERKGNSEPKLPVWKPVAPASLSDGAVRAWAKLVPQIEPMRVLTQADEQALVRMCECLANIQICEKELREHGWTYWSENDDSGARTLKANPMVTALRGYEALFKNYLVEFGMTPSARVRVRPGDGGDGKGSGGGDGPEDLLD